MKNNKRVDLYINHTEKIPLTFFVTHSQWRKENIFFFIGKDTIFSTFIVYIPFSLKLKISTQTLFKQSEFSCSKQENE